MTETVDLSGCGWVATPKCELLISITDEVDKFENLLLYKLIYLSTKKYFYFPLKICQYFCGEERNYSLKRTCLHATAPIFFFRLIILRREHSLSLGNLRRNKYCDAFDHLLDNGWADTLPSFTGIDVHCYATDLVTMKLEAFPTQRTCKQQSRTLGGDDFYTVREHL
jgi:hypothetical protein